VGSASPRRSAYDAIVSGSTVCAATSSRARTTTIWEKAPAHLRTDHPDLVGKASREDILAQSDER
jgi:hypothetical protein